MPITVFGTLRGDLAGFTADKPGAATTINTVLAAGKIQVFKDVTKIGEATNSGFVDAQNNYVSAFASMLALADMAPGDADLKLRVCSDDETTGFDAPIDGTIVTLSNSVNTGETFTAGAITWGIATTTSVGDFPPPNYPGTVSQILLDSQTQEPYPVPDEFLAMHFHAWPLEGQLPPNYTNTVTPAPTYRFGAFRNHNNHASGFLARVFPFSSTPSTPAMNDLVTVLETHVQAGRKNIFNLFAMPAWLSAIGSYAWTAYPGYPGGGGSPTDYSTYRSMIEQVLTVCNTGARFNNPLIHYLSNWNEPDIQFRATHELGYGDTFFYGPSTGNSSAQISARKTALARMQKETFLAARAVDARIKVCSPAFVWWSSADPDRYLDFLNTPTGTGGVAGEFFDVFNCHEYNGDQSGSANLFLNKMQEMKYIQQSYDPSRPWLQSESGLLDGFRMSIGNHILANDRKVATVLGLKGLAHTMYVSDRGDDIKDFSTGHIGYVGNPSTEPQMANGVDEIYGRYHNKTLIDVAYLDDGRVYKRFDTLEEHTA